MDTHQLSAFIERTCDADVTPAVVDYIATPCESPAFDPRWESNGHMARAAELTAAWARNKLGDVPGSLSRSSGCRSERLPSVAAAMQTTAITQIFPGTACP